MSDQSSYDYIVVGAGSAGCVLANRLTASGKNRVLLLEAGGRDLNPWIHIPVGYGKTFVNPAVNWLYTSEPDEGTGGERRIRQPRGKVLGGSSSINGLIYIRGQREDYDMWRQLGNAGWSYDDVLPYFKKAEDQPSFKNEYHGVGGPLQVSDPKEPHPLAEAFFEAAVECGYPRNDDFNGADQEGFGYYQWTLRDGRRSSAARAYLNAAKARDNLTIVTRAHASRILFEGRRAVGVAYLKGGIEHEARMGGELILSGGSFNTPQLLQLSGVGPGELLAKHGIEVIADVPGVGANLIDHYNSRKIYRTPFRFTLNDAVGLKNVHRGVAEVWRYVTRRAGLLAMGGSYAAGFFKTDPSVATPDIQSTVALFSGDKAGDDLHPFSGFTIVDRLLRPESRGSVTIASSDPLAAPIIKNNYLSTERDAAVLLEGFKVTRRICEAAPMQPFIADEYMPGTHIRDDGELIEYIRQTGGTSFHPVCTCRMGNDPEAVVDPRLKLNGFEGVRVVDASIMPTIPSGNTNAPTIMVAEKAADMIAEDQRGN
ncbi:MAG: choline dehydrogenase [Rhizobiales bacterium]|nr:choline dehydrogenase [Hyphomicrobiales bacterium]